MRRPRFSEEVDVQDLQAAVAFFEISIGNSSAFPILTCRDVVEHEGTLLARERLLRSGC